MEAVSAGMGPLQGRHGGKNYVHLQPQHLNVSRRVGQAAEW
jgi:hypothetical protein